MNFNYTLKLSFKIQKTNVGAQKIDNFTLKIFGIMGVVF